MRNRFLRWFALSALLAAGSANADGFGLGVKAGTLGVGIEGTFGLTERLNLRAGVNNYSLTKTETESGITYDADVDLKSVALLVDFHPFAGTFRLTAGYVNSSNEARLRGTPTGNVEIGGSTFTPAEVGTLSGSISFKSGPYVGFGWGNAVAKNGRFGFTFEVGAVLQGKSDVTLASTGGTLSGNPTLETELRQEEQNVKNDLPEIYPVVSLGLSYRF